MTVETLDSPLPDAGAYLDRGRCPRANDTIDEQSRLVVYIKIDAARPY